MSDSPLPHTVNTRKAVTRGASYSGIVGAVQLPALKDVLPPGDSSAVNAQVQFSRDEEDRQIVTVRLTANVELECQRCLERFADTLESESELAIVRDDEEARLLPERYEPLIGTEEMDLWAVVAEELALALPVVNYHPARCPDTRVVPAVKNESGDDAVEALERPNPFEALSVLLDAGAQDSEDSER